jgi:hypothetical protein
MWASALARAGLTRLAFLRRLPFFRNRPRNTPNTRKDAAATGGVRPNRFEQKAKKERKPVRQAQGVAQRVPIGDQPRAAHPLLRSTRSPEPCRRGHRLLKKSQPANALLEK